jgi:hypothetical protein
MNDWLPPETAPTDCSEFLAELSNGWVVILAATGMIRAYPEPSRRYLWWRCAGSTSVPYAPSLDPKADHAGFPDLTGWMALPKARNAA